MNVTFRGSDVILTLGNILETAVDKSATYCRPKEGLYEMRLFSPLSQTAEQRTVKSI